MQELFFPNVSQRFDWSFAHVCPIIHLGSRHELQRSAAVITCHYYHLGQISTQVQLIELNLLSLATHGHSNGHSCQWRSWNNEMMDEVDQHQIRHRSQQNLKSQSGSCKWPFCSPLEVWLCTYVWNVPTWTLRGCFWPHKEPRPVARSTIPRVRFEILPQRNFPRSLKMIRAKLWSLERSQRYN